MSKRLWASRRHEFDHASYQVTVALDFKLEDCWTGVFWRTQGANTTVWICFIPMFPVVLHIFSMRRLARQLGIPWTPTRARDAAEQ